MAVKTFRYSIIYDEDFAFNKCIELAERYNLDEFFVEGYEKEYDVFVKAYAKKINGSYVFQWVKYYKKENIKKGVRLI